MAPSVLLVAHIDWTLLHNRIDDLDRRAKDMSRVFKRLRRPLAGDQHDHDKKNEGPDGKWAPRSKASEERRKDAGRSLRKSSSYRRALKTLGLKPLRQRYKPPKKLLGRLPKALLVVSSSASVKASSRASFGGSHNQGDQVGRRRRIKLPRRQFLWLSEELVKLATEVMGTYILGDSW